MEDNPLSGLVYYQLKDGVVYEVVFPKQIRVEWNTDSSLFLFQAREFGDKRMRRFAVRLCDMLVAAEENPAVQCVLAGRALYSLLGTEKTEVGLTSYATSEFLRDDKENDEALRHEIGKYVLTRFGQVFDQPFRTIEFIAAINKNHTEIVRQLYYLQIHGLMRFDIGDRLKGVLRTNDYLSVLRNEIHFQVAHKTQLQKEVEIFEISSSTTEKGEAVTSHDSESTKSKSVFIVHGRDLRSAEVVAGFIEKCDLEPIILRDKPEKGRTIIEKLEDHGATGFAIVILSPEDEGRLKGKKKFNGRARQNVVFELGYFMGRIGRPRVLCLLENPGSIEKPSDIHGIVYKAFTNDGSWKLEVAKELREAGYDIDLNSVLR